MVDNMKWVDIFGNAPSMTEWKPEQYAKDITLIYPVKIPFDGKAVKLKFSNKYGNEKVKISSWSIMLGDRLIFKGRDSVEMEAGQEYITPECHVDLEKNSEITVRIYLGDFTNMTSGVYTSGPLSGGKCAEGDWTEIAEPDHNKLVSTNWNYFLTDVCILTEESNHTIVCFGDSITAQDWPDFMYQCYMAKEDNDTAIVRKAVSGTRLLRQYECNKYRSYGIKGDIRFPHESLVDGGDVVLIQHGINDIIHPVGLEENEFRPWEDLPTADDMIGQLKSYIEIARANGQKVYIGTLLPIWGWRTYADFREELRQQVNDWIRTTDLVDGVVDFDEVVRSPENPKAFGDGFDSGDHLHPSVKAYEEMGKLAFTVLTKS